MILEIDSFGELTLSPQAGHEKFSHQNFDLEFGKNFISF